MASPALSETPLLRIAIRRHRADRRGQGLVEFAMIFPLIALLLVMALDAGRMFFGWVALQNAARIAADFAATHADAWQTPYDAGTKVVDRETYEERILADAAAINCVLGAMPTPTFTDAATGAADSTPDDGDHAHVDMTCSFALLTPLASDVLGGPVDLAADATFAVRSVRVIELPEEDVTPPPPGCESGEARVPLLIGLTMESAYTEWRIDFTGDYLPALKLTGPGNNRNKIVQTQSLEAGSCENTDTDITVTHS